MEKNKKLLSLGEWPTRSPPPSYHDLTPITKRILSQVHLNPQQLLPLSYQAYLAQTDHPNPDFDNYQRELTRRKKQSDILANIRTNYILGKDYGTNHNSLTQRTHEHIKSRITSKLNPNSQLLRHTRQLSKYIRQERTLSKTQHSSPRPKQKVSTLTHATSQHKLKPQPTKLEQSQYFALYDPNQAFKLQSGQHMKEEDSTRSRRIQAKRQKSHLLPPPDAQQYGIASLRSNIKQRKVTNQSDRSESSRELCQQLLRAVAAWQRLDKQHLREASKLGHLTEKERDRLGKIHSAEKQEMRDRVRRIKSRLNSQGAQFSR